VSNEARIDDYVRNLLQQYDSDHDGSLNADEQSKMKSTPKNADADANGVLSREELVGYYGGGYRKSATETNSAERSEANSAANNNEAASRSRRRDFRRRAEPAANSSQFDGQKPIKMHDFATEWTAEKLKEFRDMDANHDGVITPEEYRSRK
jgi:Ca2+-binding EF-hand superfamily protein